MIVVQFRPNLGTFTSRSGAVTLGLIRGNHLPNERPASNNERQIPTERIYPN